MQANHKRFRIDEPMDVVVRGAFNQGREEMSLPTINKTNIVTNAEKELRRLCDALADLDVFRASHQERAKAEVFKALTHSGFHRMNETGNRKKRDELLSIRSTAVNYEEAIPSSNVDLSKLSEREQNEITIYQYKNIENIENRARKIKMDEIEMIQKLNELNRLHYINLKEQQYLQDIHRDALYIARSVFIKFCIDAYPSTLNNNQRPRIIREQNLVVNDLAPANNIQNNISHQRVVRLEDSALLGGDLNRDGEMES